MFPGKWLEAKNIGLETCAEAGVACMILYFSFGLSSWPPSTFHLLTVGLHKDQGGWGHILASNVFCRAAGDRRNVRGHYYNKFYFYCFYLLGFQIVFLSHSVSPISPSLCVCVCVEAGDGVDPAAWNLFTSTTDIDRSFTKSQRLWKWRLADIFKDLTEGKWGSAITLVISREWENKKEKGRKVTVNQTKWIAKKFGLIRRYMWNNRS